MVYEEFIDYLADGLQFELEEQIIVRKHSLLRNNGEQRNGICIEIPGKKVSPVIDLTEPWQKYRQGTPKEQLLDEMIQFYKDNLIHLPEFPSTLDDFSQIRSKLIIKLINRDKNSKLLEEVPYREFLDLAMVYCLFFESETFAHGSAVIRHEHLRSWNISADELHKAAMDNSPLILPASLSAMDKFICEILLDNILEDPKDTGSSSPDETLLLDIFKEKPHSPMYVLTNKKRFLGASSLLYPNILKRFSSRIDGGFYVLPSSIHETILLPKNLELDPNNLRDMVCEINRLSTPTTDQLSDQIYEYIPEEGLHIFSYPD